MSSVCNCYVWGLLCGTVEVTHWQLHTDWHKRNRNQLVKTEQLWVSRHNWDRLALYCLLEALMSMVWVIYDSYERIEQIIFDKLFFNFTIFLMMSLKIALSRCTHFFHSLFSVEQKVYNKASWVTVHILAPFVSQIHSRSLPPEVRCQGFQAHRVKIKALRFFHSF